MDPWAILGIEPTKDRRAIKRAYAKLLQLHRPDEDQDAFERLREAYERALAWAGREAESEAVPVLDLAPPETSPLPELAALELEPPPSGSGPVPPDFGRRDAPPPPRPRPAPPPSRSAAGVAEEIMAFAAEHPDAPAALEAYLADHPALFNIETKAAVSVELARLVTERPLPPPLQPLLVRFFEWDTFTEQRRLAAKLKKLEGLRTLLAVAEMRAWLDAAPAGRDKDPLHRLLRRLRAAGDGWRAWLRACLHPFGDKPVAKALKEAERRFGTPAVEQVLGPLTAAFWRKTTAREPSLIQGALLLLRITLANAALFLPSVAALRLFGDGPVVVAVLALYSGVFMLTMILAVRWAWRAGLHGSRELRKTLLRGIRYVDLPGRKRLLAALMALFTAAEFFWPPGWSGLYLAAALFLALSLTITEPTAFLGLLITFIASWVMLAAVEPARLHYYVTSWLLACLYVQWLSPGAQALWLRRHPASKLTAGGAAALIGGLLLAAAVVFLNLTKH